MHFNGRFVLNMVNFASRYGLDEEKIIAFSRLTKHDLEQEDCRIDFPEYNAIIEYIVEKSKDRFFGFHMGQSMSLSAAGLIVQISQTSETVKQALEYCCEFANLGCSALPMKLEEEDEFFKLSLNPLQSWYNQSPVAVNQTAEGNIAFAIREFHSLTRLQHYPVKILLRQNRSENFAVLEEAFKCPIYTNQKEIALFFRKEHVNQAVVTSDYELLNTLVKLAEQRQAAFSNQLGFVAEVKSSMIKLVKPEFPTIEQVSSFLNLSVRTFQRKLRSEGYSYKILMNELRKDFALNYLNNAELNISDIAYLLGYANASSFIRSFKKWHGSTPSDFRKNKAQKNLQQ